MVQIHHHEAGWRSRSCWQSCAWPRTFPHKSAYRFRELLPVIRLKRSASAPYLLGHLQRINAVAQRLAHFTALVIPHQPVDQHRVKGDFLHLLTAGEDHTGHPEENNIIAGNQHIGGIDSNPTPAFFPASPSVEKGHRAEENQVSSTSSSADVRRVQPHFSQASDLPRLTLIARSRRSTTPESDGPTTAGGKCTSRGHFPSSWYRFWRNARAQISLRHPCTTRSASCAKGSILHEPLGGDHGLHIVVAAVAGAHVVAV